MILKLAGMLLSLLLQLLEIWVNHLKLVSFYIYIHSLINHKLILMFLVNSIISLF